MKNAISKKKIYSYSELLNYRVEHVGQYMWDENMSSHIY